MKNSAAPEWEKKRTQETKAIEKFLVDAGFAQVDAYRYNSASIRVRVVDSRFADKSVDKRDAMVDRHLSKLPKSTQADIMTLLTFAPDEIAEIDKSPRHYLMNIEFDHPSPSML